MEGINLTLIYGRIYLLPIDCHVAGAQSDSELPSGRDLSDGCSDRGYTSDSELETRSQSHLHRGPSGEFEVQPVPDNGSWMLVRSFEHNMCSAELQILSGIGVGIG